MTIPDPTYTVQFENLRIALVPSCPAGVSMTHYLQHALDGTRLLDEGRPNPVLDAGNTRYYWLLPPLEGFPSSL